ARPRVQFVRARRGPTGARPLGVRGSGRVLRTGLGGARTRRHRGPTAARRAAPRLGTSAMGVRDHDGATLALYEAASIARSLGDAGLFAEAALACGGKREWTEAGVVNDGLVALLEEALTLLPAGDNPLRAA